MNKILCAILLLVSINAAGQMINIQNPTSLPQNNQNDGQYYINGISTRESVDGVEISRVPASAYNRYSLKFTNMNNFPVSVIFEVKDEDDGNVTGSIILDAGEIKTTEDSYKFPTNYRYISRKLEGGFGGRQTLRTSKIGYINADSFLSTTSEMNEVTEYMKEWRENKEVEIERRENKFRQKYEYYRSNEETLPEQDRLRLLLELKAANDGLQVYMQEVQAEAESLNTSKKAPIIEKFRRLLRVVASQRGFAMIIPEENALFIDYSQCEDVTPYMRQIW